MYRVAICEDEAPVREALHRMCGELLAELDVPNEITTFSSAEALETALRAGDAFDLLCLDILMGGKSGMELARQLRMWDEKTIFLAPSGENPFVFNEYKPHAQKCTSK